MPGRYGTAGYLTRPPFYPRQRVEVGMRRVVEQIGV